ncbi:hypothetical protein EDC01DRAFT_631957 [Geopyxis carbonaria]|nr:hypothetical protein EDC01DRAFT_631957 [Geopyxis carbonaria]
MVNPVGNSDSMDWEKTVAAKIESTFNAMRQKSRFNNGDTKQGQLVMKSMRCYECGKLGHIKRDCFQAARNRNNSNENNRRRQDKRPAFRSVRIDTKKDSKSDDEESVRETDLETEN